MPNPSNLYYQGSETMVFGIRRRNTMLGQSGSLTADQSGGNGSDAGGGKADPISDLIRMEKVAVEPVGIVR